MDTLRISLPMHELKNLSGKDGQDRLSDIQLHLYLAVTLSLCFKPKSSVYA